MICGDNTVQTVHTWFSPPFDGPKSVFQSPAVFHSFFWALLNIGGWDPCHGRKMSGDVVGTCLVYITQNGCFCRREHIATTHHREKTHGGFKDSLKITWGFTKGSWNNVSINCERYLIWRLRVIDNRIQATISAAFRWDLQWIFYSDPRETWWIGEKHPNTDDLLLYLFFVAGLPCHLLAVTLYFSPHPKRSWQCHPDISTGFCDQSTIPPINRTTRRQCYEFGVLRDYFPVNWCSGSMSTWGMVTMVCLILVHDITRKHEMRWYATVSTIIHIQTVYLYLYMHAVYVCIDVYIYMHVCTWCVYIYIPLFVYIYIYICTVYKSLCVYIKIIMYIYIYKGISPMSFSCCFTSTPSMPLVALPSPFTPGGFGIAVGSAAVAGDEARGPAAAGVRCGVWSAS